MGAGRAKLGGKAGGVEQLEAPLHAAGVRRSAPKTFTAWGMLNARIESAASACPARKLRARNLPPRDIRSIAPKGCSILFALEPAHRLAGAGVAVNALCPGFNVTNLGRELSFAAPLKKLLKWLRIGDPRNGAAPLVELAVDSVFADVSGGYFMGENARQVRPPPPSDDPAVAPALWVATEATLGQLGHI
ncbi:MAG: hypothetical protein P4L76_10840, partial [Beijerinckiaceae bacterium]|nr:hypothetical protein [Beijerinckiaceae bacterium]